jgi:hypothetical protein
MQKQGGGGVPVCDACPFAGTGYCEFYAKGGKRGGGCGCAGRFQQQGGQRGGGCGCGGPLFQTGGTRRQRKAGGYRPTKKNLKYLKKWKKGESIGFTMTSSLKAKGLIPRTSRKMKGRKVVSRKYR